MVSISILSMQERKSKGPTRICYLAPDVAIPAPRGSSVHVMEIAESLAELGLKVHVISRRVRKEHSKFQKLNNVIVHRIYRWIVKPEGASTFAGGLQDFQAKKQLSKLYYFYLLTIFRVYASLVATILITKYKIDFILERETSFGAGAIASLLTRRPLCLEIIGPRYSRLSAWRSKKIFYYTQTMLKEWIDLRKCVTVRAGVNLKLFYPSKVLRERYREKLSLNHEQTVFGYVGTFQPWHGIENLLDAIKLLHKDFPNLRVVLVGPNYEKYEKKADEKGIREFCKFTGAVSYEEVPAFINACDVMVALYDPNSDPLRRKYGIGSPIKILEYMACAKPVISTDIEPIDEIISNPSLGILVKPGNTSEVEGAMRHILTSDHTELFEMATNGETLVRSNFSWGAVAKEILEQMTTLEKIR
jgi:glycosyltransferase involved in cell wall biosynthesis